MSKYTIHIPVEQYGYLEVESETLGIPEMIDLYLKAKAEFDQKKSLQSGIPPVKS
jgi:hypothetical protein